MGNAHMADYVIVGPQAKVKKLTEDMGRTMLLRNVQFLKPGKPPVKFLGWMPERLVDGIRLGISPQLIQDIVQDSAQVSSTRRCATAGVKDRVVNETPLDKEENSYFRTQVDRLLFLSVLRPDLQPAVEQLARHASAPTVSNLIALKRLIRFSVGDTQHDTGSFPKGPFGAHGSGRCGLGWYCRTQVGNGRRGAFGWLLFYKLVSNSGIICTVQLRSRAVLDGQCSS